MGWIGSTPGVAAPLAREFRPDVVHVTGPSDIGQMGALIAHRLGVPIAASWHTNLHEYAERRLVPVMGRLPEAWKEGIGRKIRESSLRLIGRFYRVARALFAPNTFASSRQSCAQSTLQETEGAFWQYP